MAIKPLSIPDVEKLIMNAALTLQQMPGAFPRKYVSFWPETLVEPNDEPPEVRRTYWGDVDKMDFVLYHILGPQSCLTVSQRQVLWARLGKGYHARPWRTVGEMCGKAHETCRVHYKKAILKLCSRLNRLSEKDFEKIKLT